MLKTNLIPGKLYKIHRLTDRNKKDRVVAFPANDLEWFFIEPKEPVMFLYFSMHFFLQRPVFYILYENIVCDVNITTIFEEI